MEDVSGMTIDFDVEGEELSVSDDGDLTASGVIYLPGMDADSARKLILQIAMHSDFPEQEAVALESFLEDLTSN